MTINSKVDAYCQKLLKEILSNNSVGATLKVLNELGALDDRNRNDIYNFVLYTIGNRQRHWCPQHILTKFGDILKNCNDPLFHFCFASSCHYYPRSFLELLDAVNIEGLSKNYKEQIVQLFVRNYDLFHSHKNMSFLFKNYTHLKSAARPYKHDIAQVAAKSGHDQLLNALNWKPANPMQEKNFFLACCIGGLGDHIKALSVSKPYVLHEGLVMSLSGGHQHVAELLCDHPCMKWNEATTFVPLLYANTSIFKNLIHNYQTHPNFDDRICEAAMLHLRNNLGSFTHIVSHIPLERAAKMVGVAVTLRKKSHIKLLLQHVGDQGFNTGLTGLKDKDVQWAQTYRAQLQHRMLKKEVKSAPVVVRKSKM